MFNKYDSLFLSLCNIGDSLILFIYLIMENSFLISVLMNHILLMLHSMTCIILLERKLFFI